MEFANPILLALALLALPVAAVAFRARRIGVVAPATGSLAELKPTWRMRLARLLPLLRIAAIVLLAVAVAGPRIGDANAVVPAQGIDIALSLDVSSSMTTSRLGSGPDRLEAAKNVIREFIKGREDDRIGLVVFQNDALALSPPTLDYKALDAVVADVKSGILPDGTGIGVGLSSALNMLRESTAASRIVILLTDGQHNATSIRPAEAAELADALKIKVYTIGIVTRTALSALEVDEKLLQSIADRTGGRYFVADTPQALFDVYDEIGKLETSAVGRDRFERFTELAPWFVIPGAALLLLDIVLGATWLRRSP